MSRLRTGDLRDSTYSGPEDHGHMGMDWLTAYKDRYRL